jgi:hypothetical protein
MRPDGVAQTIDTRTYPQTQKMPKRSFSKTLKNQPVLALCESHIMTSISKKVDSSKAFSTLEILSLFATICVLVGVFFGWFSTYRLKSKTAEAQTNLKLIFNAEVTYYNNSQPKVKILPDAGKLPPNTKQFLPVSPTPDQPRSTPQTGNFSSADWSLLNVSIQNPVYYSYSVETSGIGDDAMFTAIAKGDLDGDGHFSRLEMIGRLDPNQRLLGQDLIYSLDPLE